jgi:hypothetical protein
MSKLFYNVYSNITDKEYLRIERRLNILQYKMSGILFPYNWRLPEPGRDEGLGVLFLKKEKGFTGNIGLAFEDEPGGVTFFFGVLKYFDENNYEYSLTENLYEHKGIDFLENNIEELTQSALKKYNGWSKEIIVRSGSKNALN